MELLYLEVGLLSSDAPSCKYLGVPTLEAPAGDRSDRSGIRGSGDLFAGDFSFRSEELAPDGPEPAGLSVSFADRLSTSFLGVFGCLVGLEGGPPEGSLFLPVGVCGDFSDFEED